MGLLSSLTSLFSGNNNNTPEAAPVEESTEYKGFTITPAPISEGGQYRLSAAITKQLDNQLQTHTFIRSDVVASRDDCIEMTIRKAKIAIDQMGDSIFS
ncbi:transcriptional regulator [Psychromonas sp. B3M02]|uniref:HlyU family transcriptional regulator n=1 Tax=Psychromonas sp. B3M02 TaxID=2267226 RepID=UPI000DE812C2|nr:HlyU family transcriptional regulator [Psychromonas sp. B3M02]RBW46597.1 transcriptional regulator [Psychromonas sp. B3M02]